MVIFRYYTNTVQLRLYYGFLDLGQHLKAVVGVNFRTVIPQLSIWLWSYLDKWITM